VIPTPLAARDAAGLIRPPVIPGACPRLSGLGPERVQSSPVTLRACAGSRVIKLDLCGKIGGRCRAGAVQPWIAAIRLGMTRKQKIGLRHFVSQFGKTQDAPILSFSWTKNMVRLAFGLAMYREDGDKGDGRPNPKCAALLALWPDGTQTRIELRFQIPHHTGEINRRGGCLQLVGL